MAEASQLNRTTLTYNDCKGVPQKFEIVGDFSIGRFKTEKGSFLTVFQEPGMVYQLIPCPSTISRLVVNNDKTCEYCHARFYWAGEKLFIQDMGSTYGTMLNGQVLPGWDNKRTSKPIEVKPGSDVLFGGYQMNIQPEVEKRELPLIFKQFGLEKMIGDSAPNVPIIINIQNLDAGYHKNIGSIDVVANRSQVDLDDEDEHEEVLARKKKKLVDEC